MLSSATLTNSLVPHLKLSVILSALSRSVSTLLGVTLTLRHKSTIRSPFSSQLITSNFSSVLIVLTHFSNKSQQCWRRNYKETCLYSRNELERISADSLTYFIGKLRRHNAAGALHK